MGESKPPTWMTKAFNEQKRQDKEPFKKKIEELKQKKRDIKSIKGWNKTEITSIDSEIKILEENIKVINDLKLQMEWE